MRADRRLDAMYLETFRSSGILSGITEVEGMLLLSLGQEVGEIVTLRHGKRTVRKDCGSLVSLQPSRMRKNMVQLRTFRSILQSDRSFCHNLDRAALDKIAKLLYAAYKEGVVDVSEPDSGSEIVCIGKDTGRMAGLVADIKSAGASEGRRGPSYEDIQALLHSDIRNLPQVIHRLKR